MNIGVIGCGELGSRMAKRLLLHDYNVFGYDCCQVALDNVAKLGVEPLKSPKEIASYCEVIITCVTDQYAVEKCIMGENGVVYGLKENTIVIETTTSLPSTTKKIGKAIRELGADLIDAPVSRGIPAADNGTLSILVGGRPSTLERSRAILKVLGTDIIHCGELGAGHAVKAINMMMMACNLLTTTEIVLLGERSGLSLVTILEELNRNSGENYMTSHHFPKYVLTNSYQSNFSFELMYKDLNIAIKMADDMNLSLLMGQRCAHIYKLLSTNVLGSDNMQSVKEIQKWMGDKYVQKVTTAK
ncbi:hypothetical protein CSV79_12935 [Sporosarcina sp. P13]|uniref:NAD(P)-dependent oxidoreductase n=1 Tax=Sporosarcina sp. P13 TaxID=2048263 RepID=UPI000C169C80|nr:NAD(P)-dependent oxidoreductase [Sporosarcina sp. P13]PIC63241.1 hypothetical protein CSV79_12935 [Sporosarcina sp. P13]